MEEKANISDNRWEVYRSDPNKGSYRGFTLKGIQPNKEEDGGRLIFTNGKNEFFSQGESIEEAYIRMFDTIDLFYFCQE